MLDDTVSLRDNLTLEEINYIDYGSYGLTYTETITKIYDNMFKIVYNRVAGDFSVFEKGVVFINKSNGEYTLVGVIKNPELTADKFEFYVATTNYGFFDDFGDRTLIEIEATQNLEVFSSSSSTELYYIELSATQYLNVEYIAETIPHTRVELSATQELGLVFNINRNYNLCRVISNTRVRCRNVPQLITQYQTIF